MPVLENFSVAIKQNDKLIASWTSQRIDRVKVAEVREHLAKMGEVKRVRVVHKTTSARSTAKLKGDLSATQKNQVFANVEEIVNEHFGG